jgi:hypothetical protein
MKEGKRGKESDSTLDSAELKWTRNRERAWKDGRHRLRLVQCPRSIIPPPCRRLACDNLKNTTDHKALRLVRNAYNLKRGRSDDVPFIRAPLAPHKVYRVYNYFRNQGLR